MNYLTVEKPCFLCHAPMQLKCAPDYPGISDTDSVKRYVEKFRIICTRCDDLRQRRFKLEAWVRRACEALIGEKRPAERTAIKENLDKAARKYCYLMVEVYNLGNPILDDTFAELLYDNPKQWAGILANYRKLCRAAIART